MNPHKLTYLLDNSWKFDNDAFHLNLLIVLPKLHSTKIKFVWTISVQRGAVLNIYMYSSYM